MPAFKFYDPDTRQFYGMGLLIRGDKGEKGDKGDPGAATGMGALDELTNVAGTVDTPSGKILGTTGTNSWTAIDPPVTGMTQAQGDARYARLAAANSLVGNQGITGTLDVSGAAAFGSTVTAAAAPAAAGHLTNKAYVDARIWFGTQAAYDAIPTKDANVLYVIS